MLRAIFHALRWLYYGVAVRHLTQTDPLHPDLPWLTDTYNQSERVVRTYWRTVLD